MVAEILYGAVPTTRLAGGTDIAPMEDQPVVCILQKRFGYETHELVLDLKRCLANSQTCAIGNPKDVGVNRQCSLTERGVQDNVSSLTPYPG